MRFKITIILFLLQVVCQGQHFEKVKTATEEYYLLKYDGTLDLTLKYPDGRWKIFNHKDSVERLQFVFYTENNKVNGPFLELSNGGYTYGNYCNDSLWTFLTHADDTTFKCGHWLNYLYALGFGKESNYKIPFDKDSLFKENRYYPNGKIAYEAIYKKDFGIRYETYWDFNTGKITRQTINTPAYSKTEIYSGDSLQLVSITQNGMTIATDFQPQYFNKNGTNIYISNSVHSTASLSIDSTKTIKGLSDYKKNFFLEYNNNGTFTLKYLNKKGRIKHKTLR